MSPLLVSRLVFAWLFSYISGWPPSEVSGSPTPSYLATAFWPSRYGFLNPEVNTTSLDSIFIAASHLSAANIHVVLGYKNTLNAPPNIAITPITTPQHDSVHCLNTNILQSTHRVQGWPSADNMLSPPLLPYTYNNMGQQSSLHLQLPSHIFPFPFHQHPPSFASNRSSSTGFWFWLHRLHRFFSTVNDLCHICDSTRVT